MSLLEGLTWAKFSEISESETTEGKYGIPRYDGNIHQLQEYTYRVKMKELKESGMDSTEVKKLGPLGVRLIEGLRGPALHIVREISAETLASPKGAQTILKYLTEALRPRRQQEARELYSAGARENGPLSRQIGEPVAMYALRRRTWWSYLQDLDSEIKLPEVMLAEQILQHAKLSDDQVLMIRTVVGKDLTVAKVCEELVAQHPQLHLKEKRSFNYGRGRPFFSNKGKGPEKGKNHFGYQAVLAEEESTEQWDDAFLAWENQSQSLGGYEDDLSAYMGEGGYDYELAEDEEYVYQVYASMVADGLDENYDAETAEYAADVLQAESEAFFARKQAHAKGHTGFRGRQFEVHGELSLEERRSRVNALKARTSCRRCGQPGHWAGDASCPKGKGKSKSRNSSSTTSSSATTASKGKPANKGKGGHANKPRTVYFAISEKTEEDSASYMAYTGPFAKVPPPTSLDPPTEAATRTASSLDGVAPASLSSLLSWTGPAPKAKAVAPKAPAPRGAVPTAKAATSSSTASSSALVPASGPTASAPSLLTSRSSTAVAPIPGYDLVLPAIQDGASGNDTATAGSSGTSWSLVPGLDLDQQMLAEALRVNSDVVVDNMLLAMRQMDTSEMEGRTMLTEGPMAEPDLGEQAMEETTVGEQSEDEAGGIGTPLPPPTPLQEPAPDGPAGRSQPPSGPECQHSRTTTKGSNQYYYMKTCCDCRKVLEKVKKETPAVTTGVPEAFPRSSETCPHHRVSRRGTNHHVWHWFCQDCGLRRQGRMDQHPAIAAATGQGALGAAHMEGVDTAAVKILELAGTVVMVQESGGVPCQVERLPEIVQRCTQIYLQKLARAPVQTSTLPSTSLAPSSSSLAAQSAAPAVAERVAEETGISDETLLQSGKHKGATFGEIYRRFPDYCSWVLSQGGNIQARSLQDFGRYIRGRKAREHEARRRSGYMALAEKTLPSETTLLAVLDSGCNQSCHGAVWYQQYMQACGLQPQPLQDSRSTTMKGIGGHVVANGRRVLTVSLQLADGTLANGTIESTEIADSEAPLLVSCQAQKALGIVLDLDEHSAYSKRFGQKLELIDRDGLPAVRLLPLPPQHSQDFAMMAQAEEEDQGHGDDGEQDFWQRDGEAWVRVHVLPRRCLYDPRQEPSQEHTIEQEVLDFPLRKTIVFGAGQGEKQEFLETWRHRRLEQLGTDDYLGGTWTGYTYFFKDALAEQTDLKHHNPESNNNPEGENYFAAFDEEKTTVLTKGQRKMLSETSLGMAQEDATLWNQLGGKPLYRKVHRQLPRGCRTFLMELFAGAAALTAVAFGHGLPTAKPVDLLSGQGDLFDPTCRDNLWKKIEEEDPYLLVVSPTTAPWNQLPSFSQVTGEEQRARLAEERRKWYGPLSWLAKVCQRRTALGRHVAVESCWSSFFWELRCVEDLFGTIHPVTDTSLQAEPLDMVFFGLREATTGEPQCKKVGLLTASPCLLEALRDHADQTRGQLAGANLGHSSPRRARIAAKWTDELCDTVIKGAFAELQDLNCSVAFAAEAEFESQVEAGDTLDAVRTEEDQGEPLPPPLNDPEMNREEHLEEETEQSQPEFEKERRRKWLRLERNKRLAVRRLHIMTGHASKESMMRMLRAAGSDPAVVSACRYFRCQACLEKQVPTQPSSVGLAPPYKFNHQLTADCFEVVDAAGGKHTILSLVDSGTKFHVAGRVAGGGTPSSESCANFITTAWLSWAGAPRVFLSDQGVHNKGKVSALLRSLGVEVRTAAARSPWQIGRTERHGGILKSMLKRMIASNQLEGEFAISAAVSQATDVKNSQFNHEGYVPAQWVLGKLPQDLSSLVQEQEIENLGVQEELLDEQSEFGKRMLIRQWARESFMYVDSNQRLRRAMLRKARPIRGPYRTGDLVSYFRRGKWCGPARVMNMEGKSSLWLLHGGMTVLVSETACRPASVEEVRRRQALDMRPTSPHNKRTFSQMELLEDDDMLPFAEEMPETEEQPQLPYFDFSQGSGEQPAPAGQPQENNGDQEIEGPDGGDSPDLNMEPPTRQMTQPEQEPAGTAREAETASTGNQPTISTSTGSPGNLEAAGADNAETASAGNQPTISTSTGSSFVTPLQQALRRSPDDVDGVPRSRSPPMVRREDRPPGLGHMAYPEGFDEVKHRELLQAREKSKASQAFLANRAEKKYKKKVQKQGAGREIVYRHASDEVKRGLDAARKKEWDNWKGYTNMKKITAEQFKEMKRHNPDLRVIPTRWVDVDKAEIDAPERKLKSRFVVRGDLEDASSMRTDSPTASQTAMGLLLSFSASKRAPLRSGDISAAFLQGSELDRKLILSMPKDQAPYDMEPDDLIEVSTTVYGTKDAPRGWFKKLDNTLTEKGLRRVPHEPGFYVLNGVRDDGSTCVRGLLLIHVDDLLWCGDSETQRILEEVQQIYKFGALDSANFKYCGRWLVQDEKGIHVSCPELISRVRPIQLEPRRRGQREAKATAAEQGQLRSVIGSLNWLVRVCRPDIAYGVARLQTALTKAVVQDLVEANNLVRYVTRTKDQGLFYPAEAMDFDRVMLLAVQDASYAADYDTSLSGDRMGYRSQSGRVLLLASEDFDKSMKGVAYPISWHSTVIRRVCKSTLQAETLSLQMGALEADHVRAVIHGLYAPFGAGSPQWMIDAQDRLKVAWFTDCFSLWSHLHNPTTGSVGDKRLAIDLCAMRQELWRAPGEDIGDPLGHDRPPECATTSIYWTSTDRMLADGLTKRLQSDDALVHMMNGAQVVEEMDDDRSDEETFDAVDAIFDQIAAGKQRIKYTDLAAHFQKEASTNKTDNTDELRKFYDLIDADKSGSISKLEIIAAVQASKEVADFLLPNLDGADHVMESEATFDAINSLFQTIAGGKRRIDFADFKAYFKKVISVQAARPVCRESTRVFIIGPGFGQQLNPRQSAMITNAGYQAHFCHGIPNPETPNFPVQQYLDHIKEEMDAFGPDVVCAASKGGVYLIGLWQTGLWRGPSLLINAHPSCKELPQGLPVVLAQGGNDEVYPTSRADLERLISTGTDNKCFLYYVANSGPMASGQRTRIGDRHNMESLLFRDCLPRLIDATLCADGPEAHMLRSWRERLSDERQQAEQWLGHSPELLRKRWATRGMDEEKLIEVLPGTEEFVHVMAMFRATPKEPPVYSVTPQATWDQVQVRAIHRVENGPQLDGCTKPYFESLRRNLEDQGVEFEPGTHTCWAFHGARSEAIESIVSNTVAGFQPLASGTRGANVWGSGTYFARDAKYVADGGFCGQPAADGTRQMLVCLLMTGVPCLGDPDHKGVLPFRNKPHRYNCSVDSLSSPEIFIVQHPGSALPAYLITFA
ncbi:RE1 [Symbiodinium microadriaticum]|nr:RE1 [Symbiodinium microadriaticum]